MKAGRRRPAYAAAAWAFVFAAMSFSWALGGRWSVGTQAVAIQEQVDDPDFVTLLWVTGLLKVVAGGIALALVRRFGRRIPRRVLLVLAGGTAAILLLYGGLGWLQAVLWETGAHDIPAEVGPTAARWKLVFWDPFWFLGGVLFLWAAVEFRRSERQ